ncbi:MAG: UvrD-helicase domain-containing protein, partial [Chloroflexi bacterium]|nr:UvrD-helicase domain-containing protein [Chloroflexota bacterium]
MDILSELNPVQQNAVQLVNGPVLVLAGPGSGKTRVLTHRVAYLIHAKNISPRNILAVTFTNKAAREMRERLVQLVGEARVQDLTIGTFHATCARFLRRDGERIGLGKGFIIYDDEDQTALMKQILKELNLDDKKYRPGAVLGAIGKAKNDLIGPDAYVPPSYWHEAVARAYKKFQARLAENNAVDFDDLIMETVRLWRENADILERYQNRFAYLHVDEFQDTNIAQYALMKLLADKQQNLFCVGDEDQSIYKFRGADFRNVMRLRQDFPNARVVLLEQNYRSTKTILDAAQSIIRKNSARHEKNLWTENPPGIPVSVVEAYNEEEEAQIVVDEIVRLTRRDAPAERLYHPRDIAIFYRTNAQSRVLEDALVRRGMPYRLVGATRFYQRREVKDLLAFLRLAYNPGDSIAFYRVINVPARGVGKKTIDDLQYWSQRLDQVPYAVLKKIQTEDDGPKTEDGADSSTVHRPPSVPTFDSRSTKSLRAFLNLIDELRAAQSSRKLMELYDLILEKTGYEHYARDGTPEGEDRWANVMELRNVTKSFSSDSAEIALGQFLEEVALVADIDSYDERADAPTLMTLHTAKGLEFPVVFIIGLEEG